MSKRLIENFKQFDAYAKTLEDFRVRTTSGATITLVGAITIILLTFSELQTYLSPNISEELFVDTSRTHKLRINLEIEIPRISCDYIVLDAMDSSGEQHLQMDQNIYKKKIDLEGNVLQEALKHEIKTSTTKLQVESAKNTSTSCGSCYGAAANDTHCCNTCEDVKEAYANKKWAIRDLATIEQCKYDSSVTKSEKAFKEGCSILGHIEVNRVGGSFHIAPGKSFTMNHVHVHDVQPFSSSSFNTSHYIRHLSFGTDFDGANTAPLDGTQGIATEGAMMFQYYIKIVPTMVVKLDGSTLFTNQFSVTRHKKSVLSGMDGGNSMPGVFFSYELSPLMVKYTEKERSIGHFATSVCAIIGGVFTVAGILDTILYHSLNAIQNKLILGKAS